MLGGMSNVIRLLVLRSSVALLWWQPNLFAELWAAENALVVVKNWPELRAWENTLPTHRSPIDTRPEQVELSSFVWRLRSPPHIVDRLKETPFRPASHVAKLYAPRRLGVLLHAVPAASTALSSCSMGQRSAVLVNMC